MTLAEFCERWTQRRDEYARTHALVSGEIIADEVLRDVASLSSSTDDHVVTLAEGAALSGYSKDHFASLVRTGVIPNAGRKGVPRIRLKDIPVRLHPRLAAKRENAYDVDADARSLRIQSR